MLGWLPRRKALVRRCTQCGTIWTVPRHSEVAGRRNKGVPLAPEMYSAARMMSDQIIANARDDAEVREALCHCPECGAERFTEFREQQ